MERFDISFNLENQNRILAVEDIEFANNVGIGQWPEEIKEERKNDKRPCLTINKLRKFIKLLVGEQRQNRVAIKVKPVDDESDPAIATIIEDIIRMIEYNSNADIAYDTAFEHAITGGFGYFRIITDYSSEDSFDMDVRIKRIRNPFVVYFGPADEYDKSDAKWCFITEKISKTEFQEQYPDIAPVNLDSPQTGEIYEKWFTPDKVRIAEYFYKEPAEKTIVQVNDGSAVELNDIVTENFLTSKGYSIVKKRKVKTHKVMWSKICGNEIIEGPTEWIGKYIPVVPILGDEINVEGKIIYKSLIRDAKDSQRMYNYWLTTATEKIALTPRAPFLVTPEQIAGHETMWNEANIKNKPYLFYNETTSAKPQREPSPEIPTGIINQLNICDNDLNDTIGIFDPALGERSNERSGKAILARQKRSDLGTFSYIDNMRRSMVYAGKILIDIIPRIFDTERTLRIRNFKGDEALVTINKTIFDNSGKEVVLYDITKGKYDVWADVGPAYSTRRQEAVDAMLQFIQYAPALATVVGDLIAKNMDWPGADEFAERLKKLLPPQISQQQAPLSEGEILPAGMSAMPGKLGV